jgi:hypothetical protein
MALDSWFFSEFCPSHGLFRQFPDAPWQKLGDIFSHALRRINFAKQEIESKDESVMIDKGIGKAILSMKFESTEANVQFGYFEASFCRFHEEFDCLQISIIEYIEMILSLESFFHAVFIAVLISIFLSDRKDHQKY